MTMPAASADTEMLTSFTVHHGHLKPREFEVLDGLIQIARTSPRFVSCVGLQSTTTWNFSGLNPALTLALDGYARKYGPAHWRIETTTSDRR